MGIMKAIFLKILQTYLFWLPINYMEGIATDKGHLSDNNK